jgi:hypothetical protein
MKQRGIPSLFILSALLTLASFSTRAQVVTNQAVLQRTGDDLLQKGVQMRRLMFSIAEKNGWPLVLRGKSGRLAYLMKINQRGMPVYVIPADNIISAATIGTNQLWAGGSTGLNLSGSSANMDSLIAIWDEGEVLPSHVELTGRVFQADGNKSPSDHSTHVAGTMIAAGVNPLAKGMAFGAKLLQAYDFDFDEAEMSKAASKGLLVSNHSYAIIAGWFFDDTKNQWDFYGQAGDTVDINFGLYDEDAQIWDSIAYNAPQYLIAKAGGNNRNENGPAVGQPYSRLNSSGVMAPAGSRPVGISNNDGYETIATYGNSKNILTLGAVNPIPGGYSRPSDVVMTSFSSWGPSGDGRIKPDLVADGVNVLSCVSTANNAYDIFSGTSMSTPATAGSSFLLQEYYSKLHGKFMRAATLKGLLIHTADEAGPSPGPDYQFGWGLIDMVRAASVITSDNTDHSQSIQENVLSSGAPFTTTVVASGKTPLTATICWTDPPGIVAIIPGGSHNFQDTARKLINDLDLRITDQVTGKVYMPWTLNPFNRPAAAAKGNNIRDNVEKVELGDSLVPGRSYQITVSNKGILARNGQQAYSLILSGINGASVCASSSTSGGATIDKVVLGNLSQTNPTGTCRNYTDLSGVAATAQLPVGQTLNISVNTSSCDASNNNRVITVYIDFNNNGSFADPGEMVAQSSTMTGGTFSGSITIPNTAVTGNISRMRIIAEETSTPGSVTPCGSYARGETQDYQVKFVNPSVDAGVSSLEYPTFTTCANDSQLVAIRIHNYGTAVLNSVPVSTIVKTGATTVVSLSAVCKDSIAPGYDVVFTYNTPFQSVGGTTYTFTSTTAVGGDLNSANDQNVTTLTTNATSPGISGTATICGTGSALATLKANAGGDDVPMWYTSPTGGTPIAAGDITTTSVIPANKKYYVGLNDLDARVGPPTKMALSSGAGAYFHLRGNFIQISTSQPLTIESARMYFGHSGQMTLTLANLISFSRTGGYNYIPVYNTTIDVAPTKNPPQSGQQINVSAGDNSDTGAIYLLNIPIPTPGKYIIILDCSDSTNAFLNTNVTTNPYPFTIPGVISITGNDMKYDPRTPSDSITYFQKFYYPFYDMSVRLYGCPGPRTEVDATSSNPPTIAISNNILTSSAPTGNQWYLNNIPIPGATGQSDTASLPGDYQSIVTDPVTGCVMPSNTIHFAAANGDIGLRVSPNPSSGSFLLQFYFSSAANTSVQLVNTLGQLVYQQDLQSFQGQFYQQIDAEHLASGMYFVKILHGDDKYMKTIVIRK